VLAVVVASPTQYHEKTICGALEHGKHVFCEKPVALDSVRSERCYQLAADRGKTLFCAFNRYGSGAGFHQEMNTSKGLELLSRDFYYSNRAYSYNQHINPQMHQMKTNLCFIWSFFPLRFYAQKTNTRNSFRSLAHSFTD
jgi:hypothetical protein